MATASRCPYNRVSSSSFGVFQSVPSSRNVMAVGFTILWCLFYGLCKMEIILLSNDCSVVMFPLNLGALISNKWKIKVL